MNRDLERNISVLVILEANAPKIELSKRHTPQIEVVRGIYYKRISIDVILQTGKKKFMHYINY